MTFCVEIFGDPVPVGLRGSRCVHRSHCSKTTRTRLRLTSRFMLSNPRPCLKTTDFSISSATRLDLDLASVLQNALSPLGASTHTQRGASALYACRTSAALSALPVCRPSGARSRLNRDPGAARFALAPGYLLDAPPALGASTHLQSARRAPAPEGRQTSAVATSRRRRRLPRLPNCSAP